MALRSGSTSLPWPLWGFAVTLLAGLLLGAHEREAFADFSLLFSYVYWVLRLVMAYLLFAGGLLLLEISPLGPRLSWGWLALAAALITLPFFTLSVTMLDLLLGLPELGIHGFGLDSSSPALISAAGMAELFTMESLYHLDNHLALCALIVVPRILQQAAAPALAEVPQAAEAERRSAPAVAAIPAKPPAAVPAFLERFDPPIEGQLWAVQAQEHYVRVITSGGAFVTLYRFGDALRELDGLSGLQVHRSFWVAESGVEAVRSDKRGTRIVLRNGERVPVSARHLDVVQNRFGKRLDPVA
jgi:LytTr DNA-binding domain